MDLSQISPLRLSQQSMLSHIHHNYAVYKPRDPFLTRHKIIMMEMTDISFISHTPEPLKGSKSARDDRKQNLLLKMKNDVKATVCVLK